MPKLFPIETLKSFPDDIRAIYEKLERLITDEAFQNEGLPPLLYRQLIDGADCDELSNGTGEFGRADSNPIPVNGPIGELLYLSSLRTRTGSPVMFHRLGSTNATDDETQQVYPIDVFDVLALDLSVRETLSLHMYHPRRSRKAPAGYTLNADIDIGNIFYGTNGYVENFPVDLDDRIRSAQMAFFGVPLPVNGVREFLNKGLFTRKAS